MKTLLYAYLKLLPQIWPFPTMHAVYKREIISYRLKEN